MYIRLTLAENQLKIRTKYLKQKILQFTFLAVKFSLKGKTEMVSKWIPAESFNPIKPRMGWGNLTPQITWLFQLRSILSSDKVIIYTYIYVCFFRISSKQLLSQNIFASKIDDFSKKDGGLIKAGILVLVFLMLLTLDTREGGMSPPPQDI